MKLQTTGLCLTFMIILSAPFAYATKCGQLIYNKHGMFRKYDYLPLNLSEAFKKHGFSSTSGATTESSTASTDPGVSTGVSDSQTQSLSTKGDCKWGGFFSAADRQDFEKYVEQNMHEIKNQISLGQGGHIETIAAFSECNQPKVLGQALQKNMERFVELGDQDSKIFIERIQDTISSDQGVSNQCRAFPLAGLEL